MTAPRQALDELRAMSRDGRLDTFCEARRIHLLVAFGSTITDASDGRAPRDLDLAVLAEPRATGWGFATLVSAFIELLHCDELDVVDLQHANRLVRARALGDGEPLYEDQPGLFAREQIHAVSVQMDLAWLDRMRLDLLASP